MRNSTFLKRLAVLPLAAVLTFASCEDKKIDSSCTVTSTDIDLSQKPAKVTVPAMGKTYTIHVQVSGDMTWIAKSTNSDVVTLSKSDIQTASGSLMITVNENVTFASRTCIVNISSPALNTPIAIQVFQPAAGAPVLTTVLTQGKDATNIKSDGDTLRYLITATPDTELTYQIDPAAKSWVMALPGKMTDWEFKANVTEQARKAWVCVKYNNGQSAVDTIHFTQKGAAVIPTPVVAVADADAHVRLAILKWSTAADVLASIATMNIKVGSDAVVNVPVADGQYVYRTSAAPNTAHAFTVTATTKGGSTTPEISGSFTSKKLTDTFMFKDGKMKENIASWLSAKRDPRGAAANASVYLVGGGISYDTLEMVEDLKLTYQFGTSAAGMMLDLLQCKNLKNIQLGRGYYDDGIGFGNVPLFQTRLAAVLTKENFPSFVKIGVGKGLTGVSDAVKTAVQAVCAANNIDYVAEIALLWPNEVIYLSNTVRTQSAAIADMGLMDRTAWKAVSWSTSEPAGEGTNGKVAQLFDGDFTSYFHSQWSGVTVPPALPHTIVIDFGAEITFNNVVMSNRVNGNEDSRPYTYTVEFSTSVPASFGDSGQATVTEPAGIAWGAASVLIVNDPSAASTATSVNTNTYTLPTAVTARCVRIKITNVYKFPKNNSCAFSEFGVK